MLAYTASIALAIEHDVLSEFLSASLTQETDKYNERGLNVSASKRRQQLIPWTTVKYSKDTIEEGEDDEE